MTNYKISDLNQNTPITAKHALQKKLEAVAGVQRVDLRPEKNEVSLSFGGGKEPTIKAVQAAIIKAGFRSGRQV